MIDQADALAHRERQASEQQRRPREPGRRKPPSALRQVHDAMTRRFKQRGG